MPLYCYEAKDALGRLVQGEAEGPGHLDVMVELKKLGYEVLGLWEKPHPLLGGALLRWLRPPPRRELAVFTRQLALLFSSGIPLMDGLEGLARAEASPRMAAGITDIVRSLNAGRRLSASLALRSDLFSTLYVAMVEAGELTGKLDRVLHNMADFLERDLMLRRKIQTAAVYPLLIFVVCVLLVGFMALFLFPVFANLFEGFQIALPWPTLLLLKITSLGQRPGVILAVLCLAGLALWLLHNRLSETVAGNRAWASFLLWAPGVGRAQRCVLMARFTRVMGLLLGAGVTPMVALAATGKAMANAVFREQLQDVTLEVRDEGLSLAQGFGRMKLMPRMAGSLIETGETVGRLPEMLGQLAEIFDQEVDDAIHQLTLLLEPLMLAFMGVVVGFVLVAVFMPVYALVDKL